MLCDKFNDFLKELVNLTKEQQDILKQKVLTEFVEENKDEVVVNSVNCCKFCGSINFWNHDKRNGKQRYKCNDCKRTFTQTTNTCFSYLHSSHYSKFKKFLECALSNLSLPETAEICKISVSCAYNWRHKLLDFVTAKQTNNEILTGLIEMDETYFKDTQKGNWKKKKLDRKPRKHSYEPQRKNKRGISNEKACISTAIDRSGNIAVSFLGYGKPSSAKLIQRYKNIIVNPDNSKVISDGDNAYFEFTKRIGVESKMLTKHKWDNMDRKIPIIRKENNIKYHIQNVNNFHSKIKDVLESKFKGVNTANLVKYINWIKWQRLHKNNFYVMLETLIKELNL